LADALAARWQATQLPKEALDNLKDNLKFEGDPDIKDLRSKLADALAARWAAVQSQKQAIDNLKDVLAAKLVSDKLNAENTSNLKQKEILLQKAQQQLRERSEQLSESSDSLLKSQRETALLNQQVLELRRQLSSLQSILALSEQKDREDEIQLQNLGNRLNAALARVASEERKKRQLEQSLRLEIEAKLNEITILNSQLIALKVDLERAETKAQAVGLESTLKIERQKNKNLIAEKQELQNDVKRLKVLLARSLAKQMSLNKEVAGNEDTEEIDIEDYEKKKRQIDILNVKINALKQELATSKSLLEASGLKNQNDKKATPKVVKKPPVNPLKFP
jgi:hypothetical protein